tara:strand:+ start:151 stop:333 length:183 start_codon:yes stop_codon:yes gene_type:complete
MEDLMKALPKDAQKAIEEVPGLQEIIEPEPQGIGVGTGIGIAAIVLILAAAVAKYKCKKK